MIGNSRIMAFAATNNPEKAKAFYENVLGLKLLKDDMYAIVFDANGIMLRVQKAGNFTPEKFTVLGWEVRSIEETINDLASKGVVFNKYEGLNQDEKGIWTTHDGSRIAWFNDPDGNVLSLTQF